MRFPLLRKLPCVLPLVLTLGVSAQEISNGLVTIRATTNENGFTGFDLLAGGTRLAAAARLSSARVRITANSCQPTAAGTGLVFGNLRSRTDSGLRFGSTDTVRVSLRTNDPYPEISFDLTLVAFNSANWKLSVGLEPFHFLALYLPEAEAWHQRGWLNATPLSDRFPLLEDRHAGTPEISGYHYNRNWSYTPPLGAHPLPVIGLWAPASSRYVGLEFLTTRLQDNSEKDIATGYRWEEASGVSAADTGQFVALVYPFGGQGYQELVLPPTGTKIRSHGNLLWSQELPAARDPNEFVWSVLWARVRDGLPQVPPVPDVGWIPGGIRLRYFEGAPRGGLIGGVEKPFQVEGSRLIYGWGWHNESPTAQPARQGNTNRLQTLEAEARELLKFARHFKAGSEDCVFWEKPLQGEWTPEWGGPPVTTLHNANGFAAGRLFLGLYRDLHRQEYLPVVDGVLNWAKHIAWTRNEFADVPSSPFAIGGTLSASFCLEYYMLFRNSPDVGRRDRARTALELARSFTYRYLVMWPCDNNREDNLDSAFLWEPNSGRDWTGAACANEVFWNLDTLAQTAVHTGDPLLAWALQGSLSRWYLLYQDVLRASLSEYRPADMAEGFGLYAGNIYGVGKRAAYGFAAPLVMTEPVGESFIRVLAGEQAALAFKRGAEFAEISDYRYGPADSLAFTIHADRPKFDLSLTVPYVDVSEIPLKLRRGSNSIALRPGVDFLRPGQSLWSLYLKELQPGDRVVLGEPDESRPALPSAPPLALQSSAPGPAMTRPTAQVGNYQVVPLSRAGSPPLDWNSPGAWAGAPHGLVWYYGVPFQLAGAGPCCATNSVRLRQSIADAQTAYLLYAAGEGPAPSLIDPDGKKIGGSTAEALAWRAWPPLFTGKLLCAKISLRSKALIGGVETAGRPVWALTIKAAPEGEPKGAFERGVADWQRMQQQELAVSALRQEIARVPNGALAVLPPSPGGETWTLAQRAGLAQRAAVLNPEQLVDPTVFAASKCRVALYLDGEDYIHTVRAPGDAAAAVEQFVKQGGTLAILPSQPWPFYYAAGPGFHRPEPLTDKLQLPLFMAVESAPPEKLFIQINPDQQWVKPSITRFAFPEGDPRLRSIDRSRIPAGATYTPLATVVGESGKNYGDAAGLLELIGGGRMLYIASVLPRDPNHGFAFSEAALRFVAQNAAARRESR